MNFLSEQEALLDVIGENLITHRDAFWVLHQPAFYGILEGSPLHIDLRYKNERLRSVPLNYHRLSRPIIFGYQLTNNGSLSSWLGYPAAWLYCQKYFSGIDFFDVCCIYDQQSSRKRKNVPRDESNDLGGNKKIHLMYETIRGSGSYMVRPAMQGKVFHND